MTFRGTGNLLLTALCVLLATACDRDGVGVDETRVVAVDISAPGSFVDVGQTVRWDASALDAAGAAVASPDIAWWSSDPAVAQVTAGEVTGRAPGRAYIRASVAGVSDSVEVTVETPLASLVVWPAGSVRIIQGRVSPLLVEMSDGTGRAVAHSLEVTSSAPGTVAVKDGALSAVALGSATVTVRAGTRSVELPVEVVTGTGYTVRSLGSFDARAINDLGWIAGSSDGHAALWRDGVVTALPHDGFASSVALAVNDSGTVVGVGYPASGSPPVLWSWRSGVVRRIPLEGYPGPAASVETVEVYDLNNRGEIVGAIRAQREGFPIANFRWTGSAVEWHPRELHLTAINDEGVMVGNLAVPSDAYLLGYANVPVLLDGARREIPSPRSSTGYWVVLDINNHGQYVGMYNNGGCYAGFYGDESLAVAPSPEAGCRALDQVNDYLDMTGQYNGRGDLDTKAMLIRNGAGILITIPESPTAGTSPIALNDVGQLIVRLSRTPRAMYLVTPGS